MSAGKELYLKETRDSAKALAEGLDFDRVHRISRVQFEQSILPLLKPFLQGGEVNVQQWISIVEHPHIGIDVYDGDDVIFKIPSLLGTTGTNPNSDERESISEMTLDLPSLISDNPMQSKKMYGNRLSGTIPKEDREADYGGFMELVKVARHYKINGPFLELEVKVPGKQQEEEENFEEWDDV